MSVVWSPAKELRMRLMLRGLALCVCWSLAAAEANAQTHPVGDAPVNDAILVSPWPTYHGGVARQASTELMGPRTSTPRVQISRFREAAEIEFGASPWHILSDQRYANSPTARTLWGVSLKYLYKYELDGDRFRYVDHFHLNYLPFFIGWNFFALRDGRIVVPNPNGLRVREHRRGPCAGRHPSLLVFRDGATSDSPIDCVGKFEFTPSAIEAQCGFRRPTIGATAVGVDVLLDGHIAAQLRYRPRGRGDPVLETWVAVLDNDLTRIETCAKLANGPSTNGAPMERAPDGGTLIYYATDTELVAMSYRAEEPRLERVAAVPVEYRGRTGTTPTLLSSGADRFLITVDGRCAVSNVFTGAISCDQADARASRLIAAPLPLGSAPIIETRLPAVIDTVENSPAVAGDAIVVSNYSGYTPDGEKDGRPEIAKGVVMLSWNAKRRVFQVDWMRDDLQFSGVPSISAGANLVYGSGSEADGNTYFYGLRLNADGNGAGGDIVVRVLVGPSKDTRRGAGDAIFDPGSNIVISDDGSAIWPGGAALVRIRD